MKKIKKNEKMTYWVFSDLHFNHNKDFIYGRRGFDSVEDHDKALVHNWNAVVNDEDIVFLLGDTLMGEGEVALNYFKQLKGKIYVIAGNHCSDRKLDLLEECDNVEHVEYNMCLPIMYGKQRILFTHYPTNTTNSEDPDKPLVTRVINISGHTHDTCLWQVSAPWSFNVCPEAHNNTPVKLDWIIEQFREKLKNERAENDKENSQKSE